MNPLKMKSWSPYLAGAGIGALSWFAFATADKPIGVTTAFEHTTAIAQTSAVPHMERTNPYFAKQTAEGKPPKIDWEVMLVVGVVLGALLSSSMSGDRTASVVPGLWCRRFGDGTAKRLVVAFMAGGLMIFGARLAQGCTSGHGISGTLQLALSSWLFILVAFAVATATAWLLYGKQGAEHV